MVNHHTDEDDFENETSLINNAVKFSVYYEALGYTKLEEEPKMSGEDFLGIVGGHLHLFLGMSLLSFVEIFEIVLVLIYTLCRT